MRAGGRGLWPWQAGSGTWQADLTIQEDPTHPLLASCPSYTLYVCWIHPLVTHPSLTVSRELQPQLGQVPWFRESVLLLVGLAVMISQSSSTVGLSDLKERSTSA